MAARGAARSCAASIRTENQPLCHDAEDFEEQESTDLDVDGALCPARKRAPLNRAESFTLDALLGHPQPAKRRHRTEQESESCTETDDAADG